MSEITESTKVRTSIGSIVWLLLAVAAGAVAWATTKSDVAANVRTLEQHSHRLDSLEQRIATDHDLLLEIRGDVKALRTTSK